MVTPVTAGFGALKNEFSMFWSTAVPSFMRVDKSVQYLPNWSLSSSTVSVVRPVVEYACPVWHTNLPIYLSDNIEMIQKRDVRAIFHGMSYFDILNHINLSTLKERRDYLCKKHVINMQARSRQVNYMCLMPERRRVDYDPRHGNNVSTTCYSDK